MAGLARKKRNVQSPKIKRNSKPESLAILRAGIYPGSISRPLVGWCLGFNGHTLQVREAKRTMADPEHKQDPQNLRPSTGELSKKKTSRKEKLKDNHLAPPQLRVENNISAYFLNYMLRLIMAWDWSVCTKFTPAVWSAVAWKIFKWLPSQGARSDEERNEWEILAFNCLTPKVTYISSAHCLLAWCSHLAPTYLQGRLGNNKGELGMFSEYYFCLMI